MTRQAVALLIGLVVAIPVLATVTAPPAAAAVDDGVLRVLLFYKDNFHASHVQARQAVRDLSGELATQYGQTVEIQETQDAGAFTTANLATKDVVVFAQTGGVLFNADQRAALEAYIRGGGGYAGIHYAGWSAGTVSEHDVNPFYLRLVGAVSEGHPENPAQRPGTVSVTDTAHPLTQGLPASFQRTDEWYDWNVNPAQNVRTLLTVDESTYSSAGKQGTTHPVTWCQTIDSGRSWYTGMGHETTHYSEPVMRQMIKNGIAYSSGLVNADCSPPAKDAQGAWSGVTPWPLMPINAALTQDGKVQSFGSVSSGCTDATPYDWSGNDCVFQGGQTEFDIWDPAVPRTMANLRDGLSPNATYTDLFCSMQVQNPNGRTIMTVGGDDGLGGNAPNDAAIGVTSYSARQGMRNEAPMNIPRWYPTGTTMANGDVVVQGGSRSGGPGGPAVLTPEIHTPNDGTGWKLLNGATSQFAYGDGTADENRWWYPRAFVTPGSGKLFNISGTAMYDLDPYADGGNGAITNRGTLGTGTPGNQGALGNPVGATSTAVMYEPGKILQVGGGHWVNGGGAAGARAGMTVDITGTGAPVVTATQPMKYQRHWPTSTVLPDGQVLVTGGSRDNNANGGYVTNAEMWNPTTGQWKTIETPHEHARLYHSIALLLPDGRVMIGGGGAPGPRNYTDVEYYSPAYLFDGQQPATRPTITSAPRKVGYNGSFQAQVTGTIGRVTLVRNGSVTHGFNNDQNFQNLQFTQSGGTLSIQTPQDGTYAPPGAYMLFAWNTDGTPSVAKIVEIDPAVKQNSLTPTLVDQFEYPRLPTNWLAGNNIPALHTVTPGTDGAGRMSPWTVDREVQLVRSIGGNQQGGLGIVGYHLGLRNNGSLSRPITGLDVGRTYRVSLKYARDSRTSGTADGTATLSVGDLTETLTATTANPSQGLGANTFKSFVGTFTATGRSQTLSLSAEGASNAGLMIDDLVVTATAPGLDDVPVHYEFEEGTGTSAANTGTDAGVGPATLTGTTGWSPDGVHGGALDMPGGPNANTVDLPDNLLRDATDFTTSFWVRPDTKGNWINLFHIGDGLGDGAGASFFQIQMQTQAIQGGSGLAVTFKGKGTTGPSAQQRLYATNPVRDVLANQWNHVTFTRSGSTGTLFLNGQQIAQRNDFTITMSDVGATTNNWIGRNGFVNDPAFDGRVDEVRLYTSALSPTDVSALYADGSARRTTTTVSVAPASPTPFGETLTVSTTVKDEANANASGQVELWLDGAKLGDSVTLTDGAASFPALPANLAPGEHSIEVRFVPAAGFRASTQSTTHTVTRPPVGEGIPAHYRFDEGTGTTAANSGTDPSIAAATLGGNVGWTPNGKFGPAASFTGGSGTSGNHVNLPNNIAAGMDEEFTVSVWARPNVLPNWVPLVQIGSSTDTFFLLQSSTQAGGPQANQPSGFAATFKRAGQPAQERLMLGAGNDLPLNAWTHVVFTMKDRVGKIYFDGVLKATREDFNIGIGDVGVNGTTTANYIGGTSWNDPRWNGLVDDFQLYGKELTAAEVAQLFSGPNTAPVAVDDSFATDEGEALTVAAPGVLANDTDAEGQTLTATVVTQPTDGTVTLAPNGGFTYTPDAGFVGTDTFTYRARDGFADSAPATVTITVNEVAKAPVAVDDAYETEEDVVLEVEAPGVLDNDTDANGDDITAGGLTQPANGEVVLDADGSFSYTPDADFFGTDTFTYTATDGDLVSAPATVTITVTELNTAPTAVDRAYETDEGNPLIVEAPGVLTDATDAEGDTLSAAVVDGPENGELILGADGAFAYVPAEGFAGTDTFTFTASDGRLASAPATVTITVEETEEPEPVKTESAIMGSAPAMVYGRTVVVTARVIPSAATGAVEVRDGTRVVATGTVTDGTARITLPATSLQPGVRNLTLAYVGDTAHTASSDSLQVRVAKATSTMKVTAPKQVKKGKKARVAVALSAPGAVPFTGRVTVQVRGGKKVSAVVRNGRAVVSVPVGKKVGPRRVTVTYGGSALANRAVKAVTIRVKR
jgi:type 1 glutamine amidotransferase